MNKTSNRSDLDQQSCEQNMDLIWINRHARQHQSKRHEIGETMEPGKMWTWRQDGPERAEIWTAKT